MEYRRLTASDLASVLDLYKQLDADDDAYQKGIRRELRIGIVL
jgi:hypothetical protein